VTRIAVLGTGPAAAQIGCEYALGGCAVLWAEEDEGAQQRVEEALRLASGHGLAGPAEVERARSLMVRGDATISSTERFTLIVDAQDLPLEPRAAAIAPIAARHPEALVASASPLPSVTALGEAAGVGDRMLATVYGDPPLFSPVVELLAARDTPLRLLERVSQLLRALGKRPVQVRREVPGLVAARLEVAMLREALSLVERGVIDVGALDELVRDSLARRWALAGPIEAALLGTTPAMSALSELARVLDAEQPPPGAGRDLAAIATEPGEEKRLASVRERLEGGLAAALRAERAAPARSSENV
jgi:3-hydroxybutyryl-CoA dehydrogenase